MNKSLSFSFIGGDLRQIYAANALSRDGYNVKCLGMDSEHAPDLEKTVAVYKDVDSLINDADVVVLPLPCSTDSETVNAPLVDSPIYIHSVMKKLSPRQLLLVGKPSKSVTAMADLYNAHLIDYAEREELSVLNAVPTAEGAIAVAMQETPYTIHSSKIAVVGYGRIGKILAHDLAALGADVTTFARKYEDFAWSRVNSLRCAHTGDLAEHTGEFDIIFNTVPSRVFDFKAISNMRDDCMIIDLASKPGGVDLETAGKLGKKVIWLLSLPGKVAPKTAGEIIKNTIINILNELGV